MRYRVVVVCKILKFLVRLSREKEREEEKEERGKAFIKVHPGSVYSFSAKYNNICIGNIMRVSHSHEELSISSRETERIGALYKTN